LQAGAALFFRSRASILSMSEDCEAWYDLESEKGDDMATIKIKGMSCNHCVMAVTKALSGIDGIGNVKVDLARGEATFDEAKPVDRAIIGERIRKAGFEVA
jgi:copper chaperone